MNTQPTLARKQQGDRRKVRILLFALVIGLMAMPASPAWARWGRGHETKQAEKAPPPKPEAAGIFQPPAHLDSNHIVVRMAGRWASMQNDLWKWGRHNPASNMDLEETILELGKYDGPQISSGWMATSALIALQEPAFVAGVRKWEREYGRAVVMQRLKSNVMYATMIPGAKIARRAVLRTARSDSDQMETLGYLYKEQSYAIQKLSWAQRIQHGTQMRLAAFRAAPTQDWQPDPEELNRLAAPGRASLETPYNPQAARLEFLSALRLGPRSAQAAEMPLASAPTLAPGREATMAQILSMAALMVMDAPADDPAFAQWSQDPTLKLCVHLSRINMAQCVKANHFVYEASFCIAQHQLIDMGECVGKFAPASQTATN